MDPRKMNRIELLNELRRHAHPSWYKQLLEWPTTGLKALLVYYEEEKLEPTQKVEVTIHIHLPTSIDLSGKKMLL